jgi:citrate lyase subunit beta / citryl-CoA lyase
MAAPAIRPRRSALYVPGSNQRALEKARDLDADVLIFDFEDGVAPDRKEDARKQVAAALKAGGFKAERVIRINHPSTKLGAADLKAAAVSGCDAVLLPKVETAQEVRDAALRLAAAGAPAGMDIWCMRSCSRARTSNAWSWALPIWRRTCARAIRPTACRC